MRKESKNQLVDLSGKISDLKSLDMAKNNERNEKEWKVDNGVQDKSKVYLEALESTDLL